MTQTMNTRCAVTLLLLMVASGAPAGAQTAGSFEQLGSSGRIGRPRHGRVEYEVRTISV